MEAYRSGGEPESRERARIRVEREETAIARAGLLVAWGNAWLTGMAAFDDVVSHVQGEDEPHAVEGLPGGGRAGQVPLGWALGDLRARTRSLPLLALALPVPGDIGLTGPPELVSRTVAAGAAVLSPGLALVPELSETRAAPGTQRDTAVTWRACPMPVPDTPSRARHALTAADLREAEHDLTTALAEAVDRLDRLDLSAAHRPPDGPAGRRRPAPADRLPPSHSPRALRLLSRADALSAALSTIDAQSHTAVRSMSQQQVLSESLRPLVTAVRRARQAAYGWTSRVDHTAAHPDGRPVRPREQ